MSMRSFPTLDDVAALAGVSTATVSRCLNTPSQVRHPTRLKVEAAVAELGYTPHFCGMALASNRTNTIGAVIPTMENAIFARGLQALQEDLSTAGVTLLVATCQYDPQEEAKQVRTLLSRGVDGLILIGQARPDETYSLLDQRKVPYVLMWCYSASQSHCTVGFDNRLAAYEMAQHVIRKGHTTIAMIAGMMQNNDRATQRVKGVSDAMADHGLELRPPFLAETKYSLDSGREAARQMLQLSPRPTAIICGNDVQAAGALKTMREFGIDVPGEISVVGFDDIDLAHAVEPMLTTVHVPHRRMGREAARIILGMAREQKIGESAMFKTSIVKGASLAAPPVIAVPKHSLN